MRVILHRDPAVWPGNETWLYLLGDHVFTVAEIGTTRFGVACLQACWQACIDAGRWEWRPGAGSGARTSYVPSTQLPPDQPVKCVTSPGLVRVYLSPAHFAPGTILGLGRATQVCADAGWVVHAGVRRPLTDAP